MVHTTEEDIKITRENLDSLESSLIAADENGLFKNVTQSPSFKDILDTMVAAYRELDDTTNAPPVRYIQGWQKAREARNQFNQVLNSASRKWRIVYLYGVPFAIYLIAMLIGILGAWNIFNPSILDTTIFWVPAYAFLWGFIGGILQGLWRLWQHVSEVRIRKAWTPWYFFLPLVGALLGALVYLIFMAGFITTTGTTEINSEYFIILLCALAGFSSQWAITTLNRITDLIQIGK